MKEKQVKILKADLSFLLEALGVKIQVWDLGGELWLPTVETQVTPLVTRTKVGLLAGWLVGFVVQIKEGSKQWPLSTKHYNIIAKIIGSKSNMPSRKDRACSSVLLGQVDLAQFVSSFAK